MKLNTKTTINNLDGKPIKESELRDAKDLTIGIILSSLLLYREQGTFDTMKSYDLGSRLYKDDVVEIDKPDRDKLIEITEKSQNPVIVKGQVIEILKQL
jgi:hypothetical protein